MANEVVKVTEHESYWSYTIVTLLIPLAGFILGIVFMAKDKKLDRKFGEHLLALSLLLAIVYGAAWIIWAGNGAGQFTGGY